MYGYEKVIMFCTMIFNLALTTILCAKYYSKHLTNAASASSSNSLLHKHYISPPTMNEQLETAGDDVTICTAIGETDM